MSSAEVKTKNIHVQEPENWMKGSVQQTVLGFINFNALGEALKKHITERVASWNCETDQQEQCAGINKNNLVEGGPTSVREMVCFATMQEVVEKQIVNAIDFDGLKATAMGIIS